MPQPPHRCLLHSCPTPVQRKIGELGAEYWQRVEVGAAEARLAAQQQAAVERKQLEAALEAQRRQAAECEAAAEAAAAAAREAAEDAAALERAHHAAELQRLREQHHAELAAVQVRLSGVLGRGRSQLDALLATWSLHHTAICPPRPPDPIPLPLQAQSGAAVAEREREYAAMLEELRSLRLAMSRASTRQEERPCDNWQHGAVPVSLQQAVQQQQQQGQGRSRTPTAPGQLMEPQSDEEDARWWERPRAVPPLPLSRQHA